MIHLILLVEMKKRRNGRKMMKKRKENPKPVIEKLT
jgi:hypothetical protein